MEKIKCSEKVTSEQVLERIGEQKTLLNNILRRSNCLPHDITEGQMTELKGVGKIRTQHLDELRNRRRYWELKEESEVRK